MSEQSSLCSVFVSISVINDEFCDMGAKSAESVSVDMEAMKQDIGHIKGVGASRLDEIMAVIDKHPTPSEETE